MCPETWDTSAIWKVPQGFGQEFAQMWDSGQEIVEIHQY